MFTAGKRVFQKILTRRPHKNSKLNQSNNGWELSVQNNILSRKSNFIQKSSSTIFKVQNWQFKMKLQLSVGTWHRNELDGSRLSLWILMSIFCQMKVWFFNSLEENLPSIPRRSFLSGQSNFSKTLIFIKY